MAKRKINVGGQEMMAEDVPFEAEREGWNTYILEDGTTLKLKTVLAEVLRVDGVYDPSGNPMYVVNANPVVSVNAPEALKKR